MQNQIRVVNEDNQEIMHTRIRNFQNEVDAERDAWLLSRHDTYLDHLKTDLVYNETLKSTVITQTYLLQPKRIGFVYDKITHIFTSKGVCVVKTHRNMTLAESANRLDSDFYREGLHSRMKVIKTHTTIAEERLFIWEQDDS